MIGSFPVLSVIGFLVMFGGVVCDHRPRVVGGQERSGGAGRCRQRPGQGWWQGSFTSRMETISAAGSTIE